MTNDLDRDLRETFQRHESDVIGRGLSPSPSLARRVRRRQARTVVVAAAAVAAILVGAGSAVVLRSESRPANDGENGTTRLHGNGQIVVSEATRGIWILDPQQPKSQPELLVDDRTLPNVGLAWSPDGRRLAYAVAEHDERRPWQPSFGVWILGLDTGSKEQISTCDPAACLRLLDWSPDGSRLAVTDGYGLYVMDLDGNRGPSIAYFQGGEIGQPSWSPDGSRIVFSVRIGTFPDYGPSQLYTIAPDGSDLTLLLERPFNGAMDPMWSPDGSRIAYWDWGTDEAYLGESATEASFPKIWVVGADGSNPTKVYVDRSGTVGPGSYYGGVSWSPDGRQLAFIIAYQFYIIDADGTDLRTDLFGNGFGDDGFALRPAWQPVPEGRD